MPHQAFDQELHETFEAIKKKRPVYSELVGRFQELYQAQAKLKQDFADHDFALGNVDPERARHGISLLAETDFPQCAEELDTALKAILPVLEKSFPFKDEFRSIGEAVDNDKLDLTALAEAYLVNNAEPLETAAENLNVPAPVLLFVIQAILSPVMAAMARSLTEQLNDVAWDQGYCPVCGSAPSIATLSKFDNKRDESLVGGGGKKRLTCSLCSHQWDYKRSVCPACENDDHKKRELFYAEDARYERIEACKKCGSYLLCVDLREFSDELRSEALPLGLVHLDIIAREKKYVPLAPMPWNSVE